MGDGKFKFVRSHWGLIIREVNYMLGAGDVEKGAKEKKSTKPKTI